MSEVGQGGCVLEDVCLLACGFWVPLLELLVREGDLWPSAAWHVSRAQILCVSDVKSLVAVRLATTPGGQTRCVPNAESLCETVGSDRATQRLPPLATRDAGDG